MNRDMIVLVGFLIFVLGHKIKLLSLPCLDFCLALGASLQIMQLHELVLIGDHDAMDAFLGEVRRLSFGR